MITTVLRIATLSALLAFATGSCISTAAPSSRRIIIPPGSSSASLEDSLTGYDTRDFILTATARQTLGIHLQSTNMYAAFRIVSINGRPDDTLMPIENTGFSGNLPEAGDYVIRVFLIRAGARKRNASAKFNLTVEIRDESASNQREKEAIPSRRTFRISDAGIDPIKLGMTLEEAKKVLPEAKFERSPDGDGVPYTDVILGEEVVMMLFAGEDDPSEPIDWSKKITIIYACSPACATADGVSVGTLVLEAEKVYGKTKSIIQHEIDSSERIEFQRHPKHLRFGVDGHGIYPDDSNETTQFDPQAKIDSIAVSSN